MKYFTGLLTSTSFGTNCIREKGQKFGTWNVTSLHRPESVTASARGKCWTYGEYRWSDGKTVALTSRGL